MNERDEAVREQPARPRGTARSVAFVVLVLAAGVVLFVAVLALIGMAHVSLS